MYPKLSSPAPHDLCGLIRERRRAWRPVANYKGGDGMDFEAELAKFLGQPTMQKAIQKTAIAAMKAGGGGVAGSLEEAKKFVEQAKAAIIASLPQSLKDSNYHTFTTSDLIVDYVGMSDNGKFQFELSWNPASVHRPSLYQKGYPDGIEDIVGLFHSGYSANHYAYGPWASRVMHGENRVYRSRVFRDPDPFLTDAISKFNAEHKADSVTLKLSPTAQRYR